MPIPEKLLGGSLSSPTGRAPQEAWRGVEGEVRRPFDVWVEGNLARWRADPASWKRKLSDLLTPLGPLGLRARLVLPKTENGLQLDTVGLAGELLDTIPPEPMGRLYYHFEVMFGDQTGLHLAADNRPPALLTHASN